MLTLKNEGLAAILVAVNYADFESEEVKEKTIELIKAMDSGLEASNYSPMEDETELAAELLVCIGEVDELVETIAQKIEEDKEDEEFDDDDLEGDD